MANEKGADLKSWRPKDWKNPYEQELQKDGSWSMAGFSENFDCYEAGAAALLTFLLSGGIISISQLEALEKNGSSEDKNSKRGT